MTLIFGFVSLYFGELVAAKQMGFDAEKMFPAFMCVISPTHFFFIFCIVSKILSMFRIKILNIKMWRYHGPTACWTSKVQNWRTLYRKRKM